MMDKDIDLIIEVLNECPICECEYFTIIHDH